MGPINTLVATAKLNLMLWAPARRQRVSQWAAAGSKLPAVLAALRVNLVPAGVNAANGCQINICVAVILLSPQRPVPRIGGREDSMSVRDHTAGSPWQLRRRTYRVLARQYMRITERPGARTFLNHRVVPAAADTFREVSTRAARFCYCARRCKQ